MTRKKTPKINPEIYVASLSDYNAGRLHGRWIDATFGEDHLREEVEAMLSESPDPHAEEWAIHDYQGFGSLRLGEYESLEKVAELGELIEEHGEVIAGLVDHFGGLEYLDEAVKALEDHNAGAAESLEDWATELIEQMSWYKDMHKEVPKDLRQYVKFDFEEYVRDLEFGEIFTVEGDGMVHVFWSR